LRDPLRNFLARSSEEQRLAAEALWTLGTIKWLLLRHPFNTLAKRYRLEKVDEGNVFAISGAEQLGRIGWAIERVSKIVPWNSVCLDQALAAQRMLSRRGIGGVLYLGVAKDEEGRGLKAHAWLKCGDRFVTGRKGHGEFTVVSALTWMERA